MRIAIRILTTLQTTRQLDWAGGNPEEAQKFIDEVERLRLNKRDGNGNGKSKVADMEEANELRNGIMKYNNGNNNTECPD